MQDSFGDKYAVVMREWFDSLACMEKDAEICPCCRLPSLDERAAFEICTVCWWEDDGQDDYNADVVLGGPNGRYSLADARRNFLDHGHMYASGAGIRTVEKPSKARRELLEYVRGLSNPIDTIDLQHFEFLLDRADKLTNR